ncbi:class I SAM-dependent methyltransferase [Gymnodinialimonas sp.]
MTERDDKSAYAETWDRYVKEDFVRIQSDRPKTPRDLQRWQVLNTSDDSYAWPGDEWGDAAAVDHILKTCVFDPIGQETPVHICELASGAGRFTVPVLSRWPDVKIDCFDVSQAFLDQMHLRFEGPIADGRLETHLLGSNPTGMFETLANKRLTRRVDAVFSFDAMVHVELHSLAVYMLTAAFALRPGGLLAMNVADATNANGLEKLLCNAPVGFQLGGSVGPQFQFTSPEIVSKLLHSMGFEHTFHDLNGRDLFIVAHLRDVDAAQQSLRSAGANWWPTGKWRRRAQTLMSKFGREEPS